MDSPAPLERGDEESSGIEPASPRLRFGRRHDEKLPLSHWSITLRGDARSKE